MQKIHNLNVYAKTEIAQQLDPAEAALAAIIEKLKAAAKGA